MLARTHEHMGQAIACARSNRIKVPWPDPLAELDSMVANASSRPTAPGQGYSARSIAAGSILTARTTAGSAARIAAAKTASDGKPSIGRSVALTW